MNSNIQFGSPGNLVWLWLIIAAVVVTGLTTIRYRRALRSWATPDLQSQSALHPRRWLTGIAAFATMLLLVLCLTDMRWGQVSRPIPQKGIEVMFVLDVSRSMLAEDVTPNRLTRAKQMIKDIVDEMAGDRVGLVLFAGEVEQAVPMTSHYDDFKQRLDEVGPENVARGGSRLGDAIAVASEGFLMTTGESKAMVLLTDGEDMESRPVETARRIHEETGATIFTIGLGDLDEGARIPETTRAGRDVYVRHDGQQVWSKLNGEILSRVATETGGAYIPAGTKQVDMADVYHGYIASVEAAEFETTEVDTLEARFAWFLVPAIAMLAGLLVVRPSLTR